MRQEQLAEREAEILKRLELLSEEEIKAEINKRIQGTDGAGRSTRTDATLISTKGKI